MMNSPRTTHTVKSHGLVLVRTHMLDWLILLLLLALMVILSLVHPFNRYVGKDMMTDLKYPFKDSTIPFWTVPFCCQWRFSWRCFPDGIDHYDKWGDVICHGDIDVIRQGHKSFPSGHSSWSFAGLGFLSLYLSGKIQAFDREGHAAKLCIVFLPLLAASLVAITRLDDYRHHWQDVVGGGLIGITMAIFCYLQFFAPPYHTEGWGPYAYFRATESCANNRDSELPPTQNTTGQVEIQQHERNYNPAMGNALDSDMSLEDLESGRQ